MREVSSSVDEGLERSPKLIPQTQLFCIQSVIVIAIFILQIGDDA